MPMIKKSGIGIMLICLCLINAIAYAAGLSTGFSKVTLENLSPGEEHSTSELAGLPLVVVNTGKEPVDLKIELLMPDMSELEGGYEPIPDLGWIKLQQTKFKAIKPNEAGTTDVTISIPEDEKHRGKRFEVFIWSHTTGAKIGVGLKSKLLFTIATKGQDAE